MNEDKLQSPRHAGTRLFLRVAGPLVAGAGILFLIVGTANFFAAAGSFESPRLFWCNFVGIPLLFVGAVMSMLGYMGAMQRYVAGESAPVAKDVVNYMGENTQPGVKSITKAATEGYLEARKEQERKD